MTSVSTRNIIIAYFFLISGCAGKADNVIEADLFSRFQYYTIEDWASVKHSSIEVETWYNSQKDSAVYLSQPRSIIEVSDNKFWVSDVMSGSIREFTANGNYSHQVIGRGKGPNEVIRPFALGKYESGDKNLIYVFDGDQQLYIKLDEDGNELARVNTPSISYKAMIDFPVIIDEDRLIWHTFNQDEFTLSEWDSLGNFRKGWV
ncbi:MAG: 6-bladed beta-propeller [Candidatus Paceibacterota bacterium]